MEFKSVNRKGVYNATFVNKAVPFFDLRIKISIQFQILISANVIFLHIQKIFSFKNDVGYQRHLDNFRPNIIWTMGESDYILQYVQNIR